MDLKLIRNLVRIMERGEVDELEIEDDKAGLRVHLRRGPSGGYAQPSVMMMPGASAPGPAAQPWHPRQHVFAHRCSLAPFWASPRHSLCPHLNRLGDTP